ncbi:MAG: SRPBCC family protein [Actinomycetota bacterium]|nr:SRPBCC family protein [Actinomycetota bacterium]
MDDRTYRYADGPTTEVERLVAASPGDVWAVVVDITMPARFSTELQEATWCDDAPGPALGARFVGRNRHPVVGEWETTSTVVELVANERFGWDVGDPECPAARWRFTLEPADGGTRLTQWVQLGPGRSGLSPAIEAMPDKESRIIANRLAEHRANMEATLTGIAAAAERTAAAP